MKRVLDHGAVLAIGIVAVALTAPAWGAADYYLKIEGVKGESRDSSATDGHKDWIELSSLTFADEAAATGGVNVAAGDVDGDGRADAASGLPTGKRQHKPVAALDSDSDDDGLADRGQPTGKRQHSPVTVVKSVDKSSPLLARSAPGQAPSATGTIAARDTAEPAALLLPAVQKVRSATARMHKWRDCAVGKHIDKVTLREASSGRTARVLDARVTACSAEQVSFNFSKVIWDSRSE
jgi:type VI protein secretion system component Hcp